MLFLCALGVLVTAAPSALGASATATNGTLAYVAGPGEVNTVTITRTSTAFVISDPGRPIRLANGSTVTGTASFPTSGITTLLVDAGDSNDQVTISTGTRATLYGGDGSDSLVGNSSSDALYGGEGNDTLGGGSGSDQLYGSTGEDVLDGGTGGDTLRGEDGVDAASYTVRTNGVTVSLDNVANDGQNEGDDVRSDIERVLGGRGADTLVGTAGDEELNGAEGDDTLRATTGADTLIGGPGRDLADYSTRTQPVSISLDDQAGDGQAGENDDVRSDVERVYGGSGADTLAGSAADNDLRGNAGADTFSGGPGADSFSGSSGFDVVDYADHPAGVTADADGSADDGATGANERDNVASDIDHLIGGAGPDVITGHNGTNTIDGGAGADTLNGRDGRDDVRGGGGDDALDGGSGNDLLDGGSGGDRIAGGGHDDTADYSARSGRVVLSADETANDGAAGERDDIRADVETLTGGAGDDSISGGDSRNILKGSGGQDAIDGRGGDDEIDGGLGDDTISGGSGRDRLNGGEGRDRADYSDRRDALSVDIDNGWDDGERGEGDSVRTDVEDIAGGSGADDLEGDGDANRLWGGAGADDVYGDSGNDAIEGGAGDDKVNGGRGADRTSGGPGTDATDYSGRGRSVRVTLDGAAGDGEPGENDMVLTDVERVTGSGHDDRLVGGAGDNVMAGGGGRDSLVGGPGADRLEGGSSDDTLQGSAGPDRLDGGSGDDWADYSDRGTSVAVTLDGQPGDGQAGENDVVESDVENVRGGTAADALVGSDERNKLEGGDGDDVFDGRRASDTYTGGPGADVADYSKRTAPLRIGLNGTQSSGENGENDLVGEDVEVARGGSADDRIAGNDDPNRLDGGPGSDSIDGGRGPDALFGAAGADKINGGKGRDSFSGGSGNDTLDGRDRERDKVNCGTGRDIGLLDKGDSPASCEKRTLPSSPSPQPPPRPQNTNRGSGGKGNPIGTKIVKKGRRIVGIPGFPGERVDRRLLRDIAWMRRKYKIAITDGYATSGHAEGGEHPLGVGLDIVPGAGGSWRDIDRLAKWAEPRQNAPRAPFRWVGYNGDANHGRGHHLHLSWRHGPARFGHPPTWVEVLAFGSKGGGRRGSIRVPNLKSLASRSNMRLGRKPRVRTGLPTVRRCSGAAPLKRTWKAAGKAFGIRWQILAAITQIESGFGCNMGPSSAGAIGWTQFMPATWRIWGMDASGDGKASPYNSTDAIFSSARYLRASGAPRSYRRALFAYNHADWYVNQVLALSRRF